MFKEGMYLERLYRRIQKSDRINDLDLPRSSVFYVKRAIQERTGEEYSVEHVRIAMWLEGELPVSDVRKIPNWYVNKYMGGKCDFTLICSQVRILRRKKLEEAAKLASEEEGQQDTGRAS